MTTVKTIRTYLEQKVPAYMKLDFDNVGHLVGYSSNPVTRVLTTLDITEEVIEEAAEFGAELIVSHHPVFFDLKRITDDTVTGRVVLKLIQSGISAICLHTNLDTVDGGVNDALLAALGAQKTGLLSPHGVAPDGKKYGIARLGVLPEEQVFSDFLTHVKTALHANGLRYHDAGRMVKHIGCCGGSGGGDIVAAYEAGCDTFVTADIKYDQFLTARALGINIIDGDHFCTENVVVPVITNMLQEAFPDLQVTQSTRHGQTAQFI